MSESNWRWFRALRERGYETKDATEPFTINIKKSDTKYAKPGCTNHCVLAEALMTRIGVHTAHIFTTIAHILRYDEEAKKYVNFRYSMDAQTRAAIRDFDRELPFRLGEYTFHPVIKSATKKAKRKNDLKRKHHASGKHLPPKVRLVMQKKPHRRIFEGHYVFA